MNHNNWLLSDRDELFLVDWEGAMIATRQLISECCFTTMFHNNNGLNGLRHMEFKESLNLNKRMKWYTVIQSIGLVQWYEEQKDIRI